MDNFLERKQGFLEYTKDILTQLKNLQFSKGLTHHFSHKSEISFIPKKGLDVFFRKKTKLSRIQKDLLTQLKNLQFSKALTLHFSHKYENSCEFLFLQKKA